MAARKPIIHGRDHEHGGADPLGIVWESVGTDGGGDGGPGASGIQFDLEPQVGGYLSVETTGDAPSGYSMNFKAGGAGGLELIADAVDNNEIAMGQYDAYLVGIGIYGHQGLHLFNSSGGPLFIRNQSDEDIDILMSGGGDIDIQANSPGAVWITSGTNVGITASHDITLTVNNSSSSGDLMLVNLPTSEPGIANAVWNDGGTLKIT